jgi:hypothetical protein
MQEPALARAHRQFVRVKGGPFIHKVVHFYRPLLSMPAIY